MKVAPKNANPELENDFFRTFETAHGRRVLWHLLSNAAVYSEAMSHSSEQTAYNLGRQAWGRRVMVMMHRSQRLRNLLRLMEEESEGAD